MKLPSENLVQANVNARMIENTVTLLIMITVILLLQYYNDGSSDMIERKIT